MIKSTLALLFGVLFLASATAFAHHSFAAEFDASKPLKLTGTVTKVEWQNPHIWFYVDVKSDDGKVTNWGGELNSPSVLRREGWTRKEFMPGEQITVTVFPSKAGAAVGVVDRTHAIVVNGQERVKANSRNVD